MAAAVSSGHGEHPANRLAKETSPYLLQHAHNPVDWWAWGEPAFAEARRRDVPIFLSIGYSTCYWCHVMERESFESAETAGLMNERFVCIKVDREERPDVDDIYMAATVTMSGHGGWPMSVFLEPKDLKPFWCGTYFPSKPMAGMGGRPTFSQILMAISDAWRNQRVAVEEQASQLAAAVGEQLNRQEGGVEVGQEQIAGAVQALLRIFDRTNGGFGGAPKFPQPVFLEFLLEVRGVVDDDTRNAIDAALKLTLDRMACGGVRDQVGGGFHRYSVDATWTVPHFEKMLYDNAQLASVYAAAGAVFKDVYYASVARSTLDYVVREITSPEGGFFSAQDAEVDSREGQNYVWTPKELREVLPEDDAAFALDVYGLAAGPNFQDPHHPHDPAVNVLRLEDRPDRVCLRLGMGSAEFNARVARINEVISAARGKRPQPRLDDKVLTSWNGLMIGAMAKADDLMADANYLDAAKGAADCVLGRLKTADGMLLRSWAKGESRAEGVLEDYAFLIQGLLLLHRATHEPRDGHYLGAAKELAWVVERQFVDAAGGLQDTRAGRPDLFVRPRSTHDGAVPSAMSVMLHNWIDLAEITSESSYRERAITAIASVSARLAESPVGMINATRALLRLIAVGTRREGVIGRGTTVAEETSDAPKFLPVEFYVSVDRLTVAKEQPADLRVLVKIADGYHVIAAEPGAEAPAGLAPFRVHAVGGSGLAVYADYPAGEEYGSSVAGRVRVYKGTFEMQMALELTGEWKGRPLVGITYQACSEAACLKPITVELDVAIDNG